jgi:hypothetical protein
VDLKSEKGKTMKTDRVYLLKEKINSFQKIRSEKGDLGEKKSLSWNMHGKKFLKKYYVRLARL